MYILDTNVISEMRKPRPHGAVKAWVSSLSDVQIFISAVTLGEIQSGIERTRRQDPEKAAMLDGWAAELLETQSILPMDGLAFREWARLMHGRPVQLVQDAMIAATARVHSLTIATRNVRDFESFDVKVYNPFGN